MHLVLTHILVLKLGISRKDLACHCIAKRYRFGNMAKHGRTVSGEDHSRNIRSRQFDLAKKLSDQDFYENYVRPAVAASSHVSEDYCITFHSCSTLSSLDFEACFKLLEETSALDYKRSRKGWSPKDKIAEMRDPSMRYLVIRRRNMTSGRDPSLRSSSDMTGFLSFMLTEEDDMDVVYCYEIHLAVESRGRGFGKALMQSMEGVGAAISAAKAMLTVFTSNTSAKAFYESLGYEYHDEEPIPLRRKLRTRTIETPGPSYIIMAKDFARL